MIANQDPDVVGLGEASKMGPYVSKIPGYKAYWLRETYTGRGDTIVLVKKGVRLRFWYWKRFKEWWTGPKHGWKQGPKRFWVGRIKTEFGVVRISVGHWPFNTAVPEVRRWCTLWFMRSNKNKVASVHVGDLNTRVSVLDDFVKNFDGKHTGVGIDRAIYKYCHVTATDIGHHGSDHPAVLFVVKGR
jgi:hypothetical protein